MKKLLIASFALFIALNVCAQDDVYTHDGREWEKQEKKPKISYPIIQEKNGNNQIFVRPYKRKAITSSSPIKINNVYPLFEVCQAGDSALVGLPVICRVIDIRKSNLSGSEGRLILRPLYVENGEQHIILEQNDIYRRGLNRTNFKIFTSFLIIPLFIAGSRAEIQAEESIILNLTKCN